jgi:hypothetical protein
VCCGIDCFHFVQFLPNHAIMGNDRDAAQVDVEKGALQPTAAPTPASEPHSIYTQNQKRLMVVAAAIASTFSPITGNIYLPALNSVAHDLKVSNSVVTLTVTFYMVSTAGMFPVPLHTFVLGYPSFSPVHLSASGPESSMRHKADVRPRSSRELHPHSSAPSRTAPGEDRHT